jgi:hypothetical protein
LLAGGAWKGTLPQLSGLMQLYELIKAHVFAAERIHGDDTTGDEGGRGTMPQPM